ncbi:acyl carrier protein [Amycolatopsis sp. FBCC-B4732]|uniref:acyl carrier protein n=1 Tax=Amycolatopsis sp. FBCC-B4732 TaxID=3079339 RepID=UPI001FF47927|nr:acyl carrier protein [Amycolatopsis sp. FBCC-B4732]UOX84605.1 acyl carrier protein [Amycolatopsis sp. FBCC-B4732]
MSDTGFTLDDLMRILREGSGETEEPAGDPAGVEFAELGYDSLALLETAGRIEREYGLTLDESALAEATTPRALVELVNEHLARVRA